MEKNIKYPEVYQSIPGGVQMVTTIKIHENTKKELDKLREFKNESYNEVIQKIIYIIRNHKKEPELTDEAIKQIEEARIRMRKGHFYTHEQVKKMFGL